MKVRITIEVDLRGRCGSPRIDALADAASAAVRRHEDDAMSVRSTATTWVHLDEEGA